MPRLPRSIAAPPLAPDGLKLLTFPFSDRNFGDALNGWLWPRLAPGLCAPEGRDALLGIGSILGPAPPDAREVVVFSAGAGYGPVDQLARDARLRVWGVRGPLTARVMGLDGSAAIGDGGMLAHLFAPPARGGRTIALAPHWQSLEDGDWRDIAAACGFDLIDMRDPVERVLAQLGQARLVLCEAMHAAIVADAMGVAWIPFVSNGGVNLFKWVDWTSSLGLAYRPVATPPTLGMQVRTGFARLPAGRRTPISVETAQAAFAKSLQAQRSPFARLDAKWRKARAKRAAPTPPEDRRRQVRRALIADILSAAAQSAAELSPPAARARMSDRLLSQLDKLARRYGARVSPPPSAMAECLSASS